MSRKIIIDKYQGNTHYSVSVIDSYGKEHHLGYYGIGPLNTSSIQVQAEEIWANEVEPKEDLLGNAIGRCIEIDEERGVEPNLD
jgi:hypothetical protein